MLSTIFRYLLALALTLSAYGVYGKFLAPVLDVEPNIVEPPNATIEHRPEEQIKSDLTDLFPADGWEWQPCTILETKQARILFQDHKVLDDGTVELMPLSMVLNSKTRMVDGKPVSDPPIVLRAPNGARLKFERPLSAGGDMGDLQHGQLIGDVQIFRPAASGDKDDSLYLETQNVQISPERIFTLYDCDFRFGESYGRGKRLTVDLFGPTTDEDGESTAFTGIERVELARVHELYLHRAKPEELYASDGTNPLKPKQSDLLGDTNRSFRITSAGPMVFDTGKKSISFQDQVLVQPAEGDGEQLTCHTLTVQFADKLPNGRATTTDHSNQPHNQPAENGKLEIRRLIAEGRDNEPAIVTSMARKSQIVARRIDYDLINNNVTLTSNDQVTMTRNNQQIQSREVRYQFTDDGRIGEAVMMGPGVMYQPEQDGQGQIVCRWKTKLKLQEDNGKKVLSLDHGTIQMNVTTVQADEMHFWLWEIPEPVEPGQKQRWRFEPAKMFASGQVSIQSPELNGKCRKAAAFWPAPQYTGSIISPVPNQIAVTGYKPVLLTRQEWQTEMQTEMQTGRQQQVVPANQPLSWQSSSSPSNGSGSRRGFQQGNQQSPYTWQQQLTSEQQVETRPQPAVYWQPDENNRTSLVQQVSHTQEFDQLPEQEKSLTEFVGNDVQLQMHGGQRRGDVQELTVDGDVVVQQKQTKPNGLVDSSLEIRGQKLRVMSQPGERYRLFVSGNNDQAATVFLQDLQMQGNLIHLDQSANRLWIEGPGQLQMAGSGLATNAAPPLKAATDSNQPTLLSAGDTTVAWQGGMVFDGQTIYFETGVVSNSRQTSRRDGSITTTANRSAALSITLDQRVDFSQVESEQDQPRVKASKLVMVGKMRASDVAFPDYWQTAEDPRVWVAIGKYDDAGRITSNQEIVTDRATFDVPTGIVKCRGPGSVITRQQSNPNSGSSNAAVPSRLASAGSRRNGPVEFIKVDFDAIFQGNLESKELAFEGNVHTFYTDTNEWNTIPPESVLQQQENNGVIMDCDKLALAQWTPQDSEPTVEMVATGNARIRGGQFNANAERISYFQGTGQVIIQAPSRSNAEIWFKQPGKTNKGHLIAKTITYNVDSGEYEVQEMKQIEYSQQGPVRGQR